MDKSKQIYSQPTDNDITPHPVLGHHCHRGVGVVG